MRRTISITGITAIALISVGNLSGDDPDITNSLGMPFRLIPPGEFTMGSPNSEQDRDTDETQHPVRISKPFYLGSTEVTQGQYKKLLGKNPSYFKSADNPVEGVSYADVIEFCQKLSSLIKEKNAGRVYRLPTEAEWEYACRAGTKTAYSYGDDPSQLDDYACFLSYSSRTESVGKKEPNLFGLYDMHGNVWEWCQDWKGDYPTVLATDPTGPKKGSYRVVRGGSWCNRATSCRGAFRRGTIPSSRSRELGFRVAMTVPSRSALENSKVAKADVEMECEEQDKAELAQRESELARREAEVTRREDELTRRELARREPRESYNTFNIQMPSPTITVIPEQKSTDFTRAFYVDTLQQMMDIHENPSQYLNRTFIVTGWIRLGHLNYVPHWQTGYIFPWKLGRSLHSGLWFGSSYLMRGELNYIVSSPEGNVALRNLSTNLPYKKSILFRIVKRNGYYLAAVQQHW